MANDGRWGLDEKGKIINKNNCTYRLANFDFKAKNVAMKLAHWRRLVVFLDDVFIFQPVLDQSDGLRRNLNEHSCPVIGRMLHTIKNTQKK